MHTGKHRFELSIVVAAVQNIISTTLGPKQAVKDIAYSAMNILQAGTRQSHTVY